MAFPRCQHSAAARLLLQCTRTLSAAAFKLG